jgi:hypothetical protein
MQSIPPPSKRSKWAVWIFVGAGVAIAAAIAFALIATRPEPPVTERLVMFIPKGAATLAQYERLQTGMTYQEVVSVMGDKGWKLPRNDAGGGEITYRWFGAETGAKMDAVFQDGKLIQKTQSGLK